MMATARKTPAKRAASGSIAAPEIKVTRRAQLKTSAVSKPLAKRGNGAADDVQRKSASKKRAGNGAVQADAAHDGAGKTNGTVRARKTVRASAPKASLKKTNGEANGALDVKATEADVAADVAQALVRDPQGDGEIVRKSRAITTEKTVPVQTPGLSAEAARPAYWDKACADLVKRDRILKKLIPKFGPVHLINRDDPFTTLARSVVGQQISVASAQAIWKRVEGACPTLAPQQFIKAGPVKLQSCGLSKRFSMSRSISYRVHCM
jgi:DNA-3-methyladenine glycosylase II